MQILSPQQVKDKHNERERQGRVAYADIVSKIAKATKELNEKVSEAEHKKKLFDIQIAERHATAVLLKEEISILEERRAEQMKPIHEIKKKWEDRMGEVDKKLRAIESKETELSKKETELMDRLEDIETERYLLSNKVLELETREDGIEREEEEVGKMTLDLQKGLERHRGEIQRFNSGVQQHNAKVQQIENAFAIREKSIEDREEELRKGLIKLKDRLNTR